MAAVYYLRFTGPDGSLAVQAELGAGPAQSRGGRSCYSMTFAPPLAIPEEGVVAVTLAGHTVLAAGYAAPALAAEVEWLQLGPASADKVLQLRWRRNGDQPQATLDRAVMQVRPEADPHPGAERARVLAL